MSDKTPLIVLAIDALEYEKVHEFNTVNLRQTHHGKTDITEFSAPRTMVLWSSFITGTNKEKDVLADGNKEMWGKQWPKAETFLSRFKNPCVIDLPGYSYDQTVHAKSRKLLADYFTTDDAAVKEAIRKEYNADAFEHHKRVKKNFLEAMESGKHDFILGYFSIIDVIGHLNFGNKLLMTMLYKEFDELAGTLTKKANKLLILSDHGMKAIGQYGDHSEYGFWSTHWEELGTPKITDFYDHITRWTK